MTTVQEQLWLGIDAGGTHCRVRLQNDKGDLLGTGSAPTGHPIHGMEIVAKNVLSATDMALGQAGLPAGQYQDIIAAGGYAGAHLPRFSRAIEAWQSPFAAHFITTDLHTACFGGLNGQDGGAIILGTGFSAMANVQGQYHFIGGHGFLLSDIASGAWFGLQAVKYALAYRDGMRPHSALVDIAESTFEAKGAELADKMIFAQSNEFARCAKAIFDAADQRDVAANSLLQQAVTDTGLVIDKLVSLGCQQIAVCGSVGNRLKNYMPTAQGQYLITPKGNAEQGAIWFGRQQWQKLHGNNHVA